MKRVNSFGIGAWCKTPVSAFLTFSKFTGAVLVKHVERIGRHGKGSPTVSHKLKKLIACTIASRNPIAHDEHT